MKKILIAFLLLSPAAFAKTSAQTHHCEVDGAEVAKTKKDCKAAKGKWAKGAPAAAPAPATPPATK